MRRCLAPLLILALLLAPIAGRAQTPEPPAPTEHSMLPRIAATAAVYGSLYAVALTLVQATATALVAVAPPAAAGAVLTFGILAVMVVAMASLVPVVTQNVPGAVLHWMGVEPPPAEPAAP